MRLLLQQKIDAAREDVQAVDDVGGDFGVEPVRILKIALDHHAVGVGVHFLDDFKAFKPAQDVKDFRAHFCGRAGGQFLAREAQGNALPDALRT